MKIQNPHDKFFKETFGNVKVAKDFINNYVPQSILNIVDMNILEPQKDSFINKELEEAFSDLLFRTKINNREGYIYFLFEHKSYVSKNITLQLLKYMIEIWETKINKENSTELPIVIPLVIYHGTEAWNSKFTLGKMIKGYEDLPEDVKKYVPNYEYLVYDFSNYTDQEIKGEAQLRIIFSLFRDIFTKDGKTFKTTALRAIEHLNELEDRQTGIEYFETLMKYILNVGSRLTKEDIEDMIKKVETSYPEGSEVVMSLAEQLKQEGRAEGEARGRAEGEARGRIKTLSETAVELMTIKFGKLPEDIKTGISELDDKTLQILIRSIFEIKSLDGVRKYI